MNTYKLTYVVNGIFESETMERWFSSKKDAYAWASDYLVSGYYPASIEKFKGEDNFTNGKSVSFPMLAVKHFFKGGMF